MDRRTLGNVAEAAAIFELTRLGYSVSVPLTEDNNYDLVIEKNGEFESVQVKGSTQTTKNGNGISVGLRSINHNSASRKTTKRREGDYDYPFV